MTLPTPQVARERAAAGLRAALARHPEVAHLLGIVRSNRKAWAIVGGAPRQWALSDPSDPSDLDIVVSTEPSDLLKMLDQWHRDRGERVAVSETAFGGHRLSTATWTLDVWSVVRTVGVKKGLVADTKRFRAVSRSAALSLDSIVLTSRGTVYETGFFSTLRTGVLCMNHCMIERPDKIAAKAVRLCDRFGLIPDITVHALISSVLGRRTVERLLEARALASSRNITSNVPHHNSGTSV